MISKFGPDTTTGLYPASLFVELLEREVARARRYARPLSVLVGHPCPGWDADEVLSRGWMLLAREVDFGSRLEPSRWAMALPETGRAGASVAAERFRRGLEALAEKLEEGAPMMALGVVTHPYHGTTATALLESADMLAKKGRSIVNVAPLGKV